MMRYAMLGSLLLFILLTACTNGTTGGEGSITLTITPQITVTAGEDTTITVTIGRENITNDISLSATDVPAGASIAPLSTSESTATLTLQTTAELLAGSYQIKIQATDGTVEAEATLELLVEVAESTLRVTLSPLLRVTQGDAVTFEVTLERLNVTAAVNLSLHGLPAGASAEDVSTTTSAAMLSIQTEPDLAVGSYEVKLEATDGTITAETMFELVVEAFTPGDAPRVEALDIASIPSIPEGLRVFCPISGDEFTTDGTCPVVLWQDHTYWPLSKSDNTGTVLLAFDSSGAIVEQWETNLARYIWQILVDETELTVTLVGQADRTAVFSWAELVIAAD